MNNISELANRKRNAAGEIVDAGQIFRKNYILDSVIPQKYSTKHRNRTLHIHDLEFYDISYNCLGVSVSDLVGNQTQNFSYVIRSLFRGIVELTNIQSGGIGFINFDSDMSKYAEYASDAEIKDGIRNLFMDLNMNTRKGCEKPYVTFNFGLDTSSNGRRIGFLMLEAFEQGDEKGNPFIFPNIVFKLKRGVNIEKDSINYDLYQKALSITAKRMIPTYFNCDSTINKCYSSESIGIMGCRTRVVSNVNGREGSLNRGNVACVTLNLVQMAYAANNDVHKFFEKLDENLNDAKELLLHRFNTLVQKGMFEDYYEKKYYLDSDKRDASKMLKNGTLSIGFIGLWDAVSVLTGTEIESVDTINRHYKTAFQIVEYMRNFTDSITQEQGLNFSLLASAAEGVTGNFAQYDDLHSGKNFSVCKKGFYTNSFHVPVNLTVNYMEKINIESKFHHLCNGGSITYVEFEEMPGINVEAVQEIIEYGYRNDCNYIGVNFPLDYCGSCSYTGRIVDSCPLCKSNNVKRLRRVSGYLSEESSFTSGKRKELNERTFNMSITLPGDVIT